MISILVPVYNEEGNVFPLCEQVFQVMRSLGRPFEVIMVDDGSGDGSFKELSEAVTQYLELRVIRFRRNCGQTAAMMAAIDEARGDILVPLDADLQNDPADIPRLIEKLEEGYDLVSGWRYDRKDAKVRRVYISRVANWLISKISGVRPHDYGCSLKAYRRDVIKNVRLYGEMHRFIPIYASWQGARWTELRVNHRPRQIGTSKYGLGRIAKVLLDLVIVVFLDRYLTKPGYIFGGFGIVCFLMSMLFTLYSAYLKVFEGISFIVTPLPLLSVTFFVTSVLSILLGILAEIMVRTYFESQQKRPYDIRDRLDGGES